MSKCGICIISGLAFGIDSISHSSAMYNLGRTIAVLGSGFNNIYPRENESLYHKILDNKGCVISEYSPETEINKNNFPRRNELISALSIGVLVIEAKYRSGSSITANKAFKQRKKVFAIPSNIDSKLGVGTNRLIQKGGKLVMDPNDILKELNINKQSKIKQDWKYEEKIVPNEFKKIYNAIGNMPTDINFICRKTGLTVQEVSRQLTILELNEYIKTLPGGMFIRV